MIALVGPGNARDHAFAERMFAERASGFVFYLIGRNYLLESRPFTVRIDEPDPYKLAKRMSSDGVERAIVLDPLLLIEGWVDAISSLSIDVFGPRRIAARLEGSKAAMVGVLDGAGLRHPRSTQATEPLEAKRIVDTAWSAGERIVLKVDQYLVDANIRTIVPQHLEDARNAIDLQFEALEKAGLDPKILVESFVDGWECSVHVLWDGHSYALMPPVKDYKRACNGDRGSNTHGAAALASGPGWTEELENELKKCVVEPLLSTLKDRALDYVGVVYIGVMIGQDGHADVLEINVRPGSPEILALLGLLKSPLSDVIDAAIEKRLCDYQLEWKEGYAGAVFAMAEGYPEQERFMPVPITGLDRPHADARLYAEGVGEDASGNPCVTGGRVVAVTAHAHTIAAIRQRIYGDLSTLHFRGMHMRTDLGEGIFAGLFHAHQS